MPNLTNRFLQGSGTSGTVKNAGLPNITAVASAFFCNSTSISTTGAMYQKSAEYGDLHGSEDPYKQYVVGLGFSASRSNSVYGNSTTVQPPALTCLICIKY